MAAHWFKASLACINNTYQCTTLGRPNFFTHLFGLPVNRRWVWFFHINRKILMYARYSRGVFFIISFDFILCGEMHWKYNRFFSLKHDSLIALCRLFIQNIVHYGDDFFFFNSVVCFFLFLSRFDRHLTKELWCKVFKMLPRYFIIRLGSSR